VGVGIYERIRRVDDIVWHFVVEVGFGRLWVAHVGRTRPGTSAMLSLGPRQRGEFELDSIPPRLVLSPSHFPQPSSKHERS